MNDSQNKIPRNESQARLERLSRRESVSHNTARYSRFVRLMRLALPLAAVGLVALVFIRMNGEQDTIVPMRLDEKELKSKNIAKNELMNPKFESTDKKGQPYEITALRAVQGEINKDLIMLEEPVGVLTMNDGTRIKVRSKTGAYRQDTERFYLEGSVFMEHAQGYTLASDEAHVDLKNNFAWSEQDVQGTGPDMHITASGMQANGKTGEVIFTGPATLTLEKGFKGFE